MITLLVFWFLFPAHRCVTVCIAGAGNRNCPDRSSIAYPLTPILFASSVVICFSIAYTGGALVGVAVVGKLAQRVLLWSLGRGRIKI